ncbi:MAG: hypothetical protein HY783_04660, partial [Chloroflexi bacterium]|nr:hypothetical protein [Chloroflexota bacterium]
MRTLSATLLAAQKATAHEPYVRVRVIEKVANVNRLLYTKCYTGSEASNRAAVAVFGDGSLVRMREDAGNVYWDRIASPGPSSVYSNWTLIGAYIYPAICASGANGLRFFLSGDGLTLYAQSTTDNGVTWSAASAIYTAASAIGHLAAAMKSDGTVLVIFSIGANVYKIKRVS